MSSSEWNWSWVASKEDTLKASGTVDQSGGTLYSYRAASRGQLSASELKSSVDSASTNINHLWSLWSSYVRPVIDSLPAGSKDQRWRPGTGLPDKIDALGYGIQGTTLFVSNDSTADTASGRYWDSTDERPKTITEAMEDLWTAVNALDVTSDTSTAAAVLEPLWAAIGHRMKDSSLTSLSSSLDARTGQIETNMTQLDADIYGGIGAWTFGTPLTYSIALNLDALLKVHTVPGGWQNNPSGIGHAAVAPAAHTHPTTQIGTLPGVALSQARVAPYASLWDDILRVRWEITRTRGSANWQSDIQSSWQVGAEYTSLASHIAFAGSGFAGMTNPHGINYINTGANTMFTNHSRFTGMTDYTSAVEMPIYTSTVFVTQNTDLTAAIGELDSAIQTALSSVDVRYDYTYDRSDLSEIVREQTPIVITHSVGRKPIVQILDVSPQEEDYWGQYVSPAIEGNIVHISPNAFEIWTGAAKIEVIAIF